jgi:DNA-binding MarR family transcriptional regulator
LSHASSAGLAASGALLTLVGLVVALGGYLSRISSSFDLIVGLGLTLSGSLLFARHKAAAWTYGLVFAGTLRWSLSNIVAGSTPAHRLVERPAARDRAPGSPDEKLHSTSEGGNERISAMIYDWQTSLRASDYHAARIVPPAMVEETGWDILLALHSDRHCCLRLPALASIVSVRPAVVDRWLGALEERELITGARHPSTDELLAVLTEKGRKLLDRYFSATDGLQVGA